MNSLQDAANLHKNVPPDWYFQSIRRNLFQRYWHKMRFREVKKEIEPAKTVLDIGSADGLFSREILNKTKADKLIGIDVLQSSVSWANKHWRTKKLEFMVGDAHDLPFAEQSFDAVFALEVMEHVRKPSKVLKEMKRVLKKDGYAIMLVPTDSTLFKSIWWFVTNFWWAKIWDDCHIQSFDKDNKLSKHAKKAGFKIEVDRNFAWGMLNIIKIIKIK